MAATLADLGAQVLCNPHSLTVVFPEPDAEIVLRYQLASAKGLAHAIVMPNVANGLLDSFAADFAGWMRQRPKQA